ncbi:MAG: hypothetical protein Q8P18_20205 [Pseudomonadota bacterium]|nr:hypothetical protein [Pseudomonadota bacterium]
MPIRILLLLPLLGCPEPFEPDPSFCTDLMETQPGCMTEDNLAECEEANEECPGGVLVMESCPLQFGCS